MNVITTPFADDFNILTRDKVLHQQIVKDVEKKIQSMGLIIKPRKCRSLSIVNGKTEKIPFFLHNKVEEPVVIASVVDEPMKFLGSEIGGVNTPQEMAALIYLKLRTKLENIDKSTLRGEFKVKIYSRYALPSMRYYLNVHQLHQCHMNQLDSLAKSFLKNWLQIQKHGVTDTAIFHPYMLGLQTPSQIYLEAHASTLAMIKTKGDPLVNHAVNSRLERESLWTRKHSTTKTVHKMWEEHIQKNPVNDPSLEQTPINMLRNVKSAKNAMKKSVKLNTIQYWNTKVGKLTFQGDFLKLLIEEKENATWQGVIQNVPKGVLSFALKACSNGLNTPDNLKHWGIRKTNKCDLCGNFSNLEHILNWCPVSLKEGRFKWRHDSILSHFTKAIKSSNTKNLLIYADLPGMTYNGGTIPADIVATSLRPDIVLVNRKDKSIEILELTCSFEKNINSANLRKSTNYLDLKTDIETAGWKTSLLPFEVGSRGQITTRNKKAIIESCKRNQLKMQHI